MTWEALSALASLVTAAVITATAIIAVVQLRHLRTANQLSAALSLYTELDDAALRKARSFVHLELEERMKDASFREQLIRAKFDREVHLEIKLGNYWENFGLLLRTGLLDKTLFLDWGAAGCLYDWRMLRDVTRAIRGARPEVWRDFEYLARLSATHLDSMERHPLRQPKWREGLEELDVRKAPAGP